MKSPYLQVFISAENKEQANAILDALLKEKLILGGPILEGPMKGWWKNEIVEMNYCYILTFTKTSLKERVIEVYEKVSKEEVPTISFIPFEGSAKLYKFIDETLK